MTSLISPTAGAEARQFVEDLCRQAENHRAVNHPYLQRLAAGDVPDIKSAIADFAFQYHAYSSDFIRYLTATISQLPDRSHRTALLQNLFEESGRVEEDEEVLLKEIGIELEWIQGIPHPQLFIRFLNAIGIDETYRKTHPFADEALIWRDLFYDICSKGGPARALGAIGLGTENVVKFIYRPVLVAIERHLNISRRDRVFFDLHAALDDEHGDVLTNIAIDYAHQSEHRQPLKEGMLMALSIRGAFFDALEQRAEAGLTAA